MDSLEKHSILCSKKNLNHILFRLFIDYIGVISRLVHQFKLNYHKFNIKFTEWCAKLVIGISHFPIIMIRYKLNSLND